MIVDFNSNVNSLPKQADFCVVGSGPAGMTLALELEHHGRSVLLLEGGGLNGARNPRKFIKGR